MVQALLLLVREVCAKDLTPLVYDGDLESLIRVWGLGFRVQGLGFLLRRVALLHLV